MIIIAGAKGKRKLILTAESKDSKAYVRIIGRISSYNDNNSKDFQIAVDRLLKLHSECEVYLNTEGGSVFDATEITNQLNRFKKVTITVGALCASAGTYPVAKFRTGAYPSSQFMIHKPMLGTYGNEDEIESDLKMLKSTTVDYKKAYAKKMGISESDVEKLWNRGDYWMTAEEALEKKLIDYIINEDEEEITSEMVKVLEACGAPNIPTPSKPKATHQSKIQTVDMNKEELIAWLGLPADATDDQIEAAKKTMKVNALKYHDAEAAKKEKEDGDKKKTAKDLVAQALKDKKIQAKQVPHYEELAEANPEATKKLLDALAPIPKLSSETTSKTDDDADEEGRKDWKLEDYLEKDPEAFEKLLSEDPKKAEKLQAAYYGK